MAASNVKDTLPKLTDVKALTLAADRAIYFTSSTAIALMTVTSAARNLLDDTTAGAMLTTLGGTTVGQALLTLTNPGAITFPRLNADNTVTALSASDFRTAIGAGTGSGNALTANPLSQFAATTSLELKGVISDETGSGALVFANTPTLVTPALGAATATTLVASGSVTANGFNSSSGDIGGASVSWDNTFVRMWEYIVAGSGYYVRWNSGGNYATGTADTKLLRVSAGLLAITDSESTGNPGLAFRGRTSTTNNRDRLRITTSAIDNTEGSQKYQADIDIYDTAARNTIRLVATGSAAKIGLLGAVGEQDVYVNSTFGCSGAAMIGATATGVLDSANGLLQFNGNSILDFQGGALNDTAGLTSVQADARRLYDPSGNIVAFFDRSALKLSAFDGDPGDVANQLIWFDSNAGTLKFQIANTIYTVAVV